MATQVLIVDDSAVIRGLLARALEEDRDIAVCGTAMHGEAALSALRRSHVDIVLLDVEMPVMDGLTALPKILAEFPYVRVVMASTLTTEGAETTVKALALGAAGCIAKPVATSATSGIKQVAQELLPLVKALTNGHTRHPSTRSAPVSSAPVRTIRKRQVAPTMVAIGTSTGGPNALSRVLSEIPEDFSPPIFIVQHMPPMFTPMLAKHLARDGRRPCKEAVDGEPVQRHHTYIAPGDYHLEVARRDGHVVTLLHQESPEHFCRPSVNPLFRSVANTYGSQVLAVMLTGMGEDGIEGTREISARGGYVLAQDQQSSVVWGMPAAVVREQLADEVLPLDLVASTISRLCK